MDPTLAATVDILRAASAIPLEFDEGHRVVYPGARPSAETAECLYALAKEAQDTAHARACSSVLVGASSESDDTGDVAFWLGAGDYGSADKVLQALGITAVRVPMASWEPDSLHCRRPLRWSQWAETSASALRVQTRGSLFS